jgi:hypothetical protein
MKYQLNKQLAQLIIIGFIVATGVFAIHKYAAEFIESSIYTLGDIIKAL